MTFKHKPPKSKGFLFARFIDAQGEAKKIGFEQINTLDISNGYLWLHLDRDDKRVIQWLHDEPDIDDMVVDVLKADDSRPRIINHHQGVLINLRGVNLNPQHKPEDMLPIRLWIHQHLVITMQIDALKSVDELLTRVDAQNAPKTQGEFVVDLAKLLLFNIESTVDELEYEIDVIEQNVFNDDSLNNVQDRFTLKKLTQAKRSQSQGVAQELSYVRRTAIMLHRFLAPQQIALNNFSHLEYSWITSSDRFELQDVTDQTARITEELEEIRKRAAIAHEFMAEQNMEKMNTTMLLLAVVSVVFMPMGLVSGLLGMNVAGVPWTENPLGFTFTVLLILLMGFITALVLKIFKLF